MTVGVPTYNRAASLPRAVESVLGQTYGDLRVLIADNASTDATTDVCAELAARDPRVQVLRNERNIGLTGNFNRIFKHATSEFVMVLADDDWLEEDYVERCLAALEGDPGLVIASGGARYHPIDEAPFPGVELDLLDPVPDRRVLRYFRGVRDNVTIYGLIRRSALAHALPMQNTLAGDWLLCARLAMQGRIRTLPATWVNRSAAGTSSSYARTVSSMGLSDLERRRPHLAIARFVYLDIARDAAIYESLGPTRRRLLALACAAALLAARPLDVIDDLLGPTLRRSRLRWLNGALRPIARRMRP